MGEPDRRRLVRLTVLELAVRRDHPMSPADWRAVRRHARRGTEAPEELRAAVLRAWGEVTIGEVDNLLRPGVRRR